MHRNLIIKIAKYGLQSCMIALFLVLISLVVLIVHWTINTPFYSDFYLVDGFKAGLSSFNLRYTDELIEGISLDQLSYGVILWLVSRTSLLVIIGIFSIKIFINILNSIANLKVFYDENIKAFKKLVVLGLITSVIASFNFGIFDNEMFWNFTIPFRPILYTFFCLVMAEVFKEGKRLQEDAESIV